MIFDPSISVPSTGRGNTRSVGLPPAGSAVGVVGRVEPMGPDGMAPGPPEPLGGDIPAGPVGVGMPGPALTGCCGLPGKFTAGAAPA